MQDEKEFIKALQNPHTQRKAFAELIAQYEKPLYFHVRTIVLNHDDTNDVLQNTFIKVFQNLKDFKEESKLYSWLFRIATNEALTYINKAASKNNNNLVEYQQKAVDNLVADIYFEGDAIQLKLQRAIAILPEKQQLVFKMRYFEDLKYEEISEILHTSVGALKASYHIAVKKIEEFIKT